jgi:hypothetical protein
MRQSRPADTARTLEGKRAPLPPIYSNYTTKTPLFHHLVSFFLEKVTFGDQGSQFNLQSPKRKRASHRLSKTSPSFLEETVSLLPD